MARGDQYIKTLKNLPDIAPSNVPFGFNKTAAKIETAAQKAVVLLKINNANWLATARRDIPALKESQPGLPEIDARRLMGENRTVMSRELRVLRTKAQTARKLASDKKAQNWWARITS